MDAPQLQRIRRQAEAAVSDMPEGSMKIKAFEVILNRLLQDDRAEGTHRRPARSKKSLAAQKPAAAQTAGARVLVLREDGFFTEQKSISEIREALRAHGWHYPITSLSGRLQELVRQGHLRRERLKQSGKKIWKYSNP